MYALLRLLQTNAHEDEKYLVVLCALAAGLFILTYLVYRRSPGKVRRRRAGTATESTEEIAEALARTRVWDDSSC